MLLNQSTSTKIHTTPAKLLGSILGAAGPRWNTEDNEVSIELLPEQDNNITNVVVNQPVLSKELDTNVVLTTTNTEPIHPVSPPTESEETQTEEDNNLSVKDVYIAMMELTENVKNCAMIPALQLSIESLQKDMKDKLASLQGQVLINSETLEKLSATSINLTSKMKPLISQMETNTNKILANEKSLLEIQQTIDSELNVHIDDDHIGKIAKQILDVELTTVQENLESSLNSFTDDLESSLDKKLESWFDSKLESSLNASLDKKQESSLDDLEASLIAKLKRALSSEMVNIRNTPDPVIEKLTQDNSNLHRAIKDAESRIKDLEEDSNVPAKPSQVKVTDHSDHPVIKHETVFLGDSNTTKIDMRRIGKGVLRKRFTCYHALDVIKFMKEVEIKSAPTKLFLHIGTNDVAQSGNADNVVENIKVAIQAIRDKLPDVRIFVSSIFCRKDSQDPLNAPIGLINEELERLCDSTANLSFMDNSRIRHNMMKDPKHLNDKGFLEFLKNIRYSIFGEVPWTSGSRRR